jgi:hypothetical protein
MLHRYSSAIREVRPKLALNRPMTSVASVEDRLPVFSSLAAHECLHFAVFMSTSEAA